MRRLMFWRRWRTRRQLQVECLLALYDPEGWTVRRRFPPNGYAEPWCDQ